MSCSKWAYIPSRCDGEPCPGDCDCCGKAEDNVAEMEEEHMTNEEIIKRLQDFAAGTMRDEDAELAFEAIAALSRDRWISVEERLPEGHEYVLCCGSKGGQFVGWVAQSVRGKKAYAFQHGGNGRRITHWRPLPEPPKEGT